MSGSGKQNTLLDYNTRVETRSHVSVSIKQLNTGSLKHLFPMTESEIY